MRLEFLCLGSRWKGAQDPATKPKRLDGIYAQNHVMCAVSEYNWQFLRTEGRRITANELGYLSVDLSLHTYIHTCMHACIHTSIHTCIVYAFFKLAQHVLHQMSQNPNVSEPPNVRCHPCFSKAIGCNERTSRSKTLKHKPNGSATMNKTGKFEDYLPFVQTRTRLNLDSEPCSWEARNTF